MHLVDNGKWSLDDIAEGKHWKLITGTAALILRRAEKQVLTRIVKVKSHSGIKGNDMADELAREAACENKFLSQHWGCI